MKTTLIANIPCSIKKQVEDLIRSAEGEVIFEGDYTEKIGNSSENSTILKLHYDNDDGIPLILCDDSGQWVREISRDEASLLAESGVVKKLKCLHPAAYKYGNPLCSINIPEIWKAICGNLGFDPDTDMTCECEDTEDDSVGCFSISLAVPESTVSKIEEVTNKVYATISEEWERDETEIQYAMYNFSNKTDEELAEELKESESRFKATGGRGVELADRIDRIRILQTMRETINNARDY